MNELLVLAVAGIGMWAMRASAIVLVGGRTLPESTTRAVGYARHAVLAALVAAAVSGGRGLDGALTPSPQLLAALAAGIVAWRTGSMLWTLAAGVASVAALSAVWP